jgi:hypothetical protein
MLTTADANGDPNAHGWTHGRTSSIRHTGRHDIGKVAARRYGAAARARSPP